METRTKLPEIGRSQCLGVEGSLSLETVKHRDISRVVQRESAFTAPIALSLRSLANKNVVRLLGFSPELVFIHLHTHHIQNTAQFNTRMQDTM